MNIWIAQRGRARYPRVKVQMDHMRKLNLKNVAIVGVDPPDLIDGALPPEDFELVSRYLTLNREPIIEHWYERTDSIELIRDLKRLT